jgi:hypothetical protein
MNEEPLGSITWKYKAAQRRFIDRVLWDRLQRGSPVYNGDLIRTAELSEATVAFFRGGFVDLEENSIVQIFEENAIPRLELKEGSVTVNAQGSDLVFSSGGNVVTVQDGDAAELHTGVDGPDIETIQAAPVVIEQIPPPVPVTPAEGQVFSYNKELPKLRFRWSVPASTDKSTEAAFYLLEASDNQNMNNPQLRMQTRTTSVLYSQLGPGRWYWRITPAYGNGQQFGDPSPIASFVIEQNAAIVEIPPVAINIAAVRPSQSLQSSQSVSSTQSTQSAQSTQPAQSTQTAQSGTSAVTQDNGLRPIFPPDNYTVAESLLVDLRFTWRGGARGNRFQISANTEFTNPVVNTQVSGEMTQVRRLEAGTWYWRVYSSTSAASQTRRLVVAPALAAPVPLAGEGGAGGVMVVAPGQRGVFRWQPVEGADYYQFRLFSEADGKLVYSDSQLKDTALSISMDQYSEGKYRWVVQAFTNQGADTSRRNGLSGETRFELAKSAAAQPQVQSQGGGQTLPPNNYVYNAERLQGISAITFRWDTVDGAATYNFTLSRENGAQIISQRVSGNIFALSDLSVLSRGSFVWQVEALDGSGTRLGNAVRNRFTVDLAEIQRTQIQDLDTMYGNN